MGRKKHARRLPVGAARSSAVLTAVHAKLDELPGSLPSIVAALARVQSTIDFDAPLALLVERVEAGIDGILAAPPETLGALVRLAGMVEPSRGARWLRRVAHHPSPRVRARAHQALQSIWPTDRTLPNRAGQDDWRAWFWGSTGRRDRPRVARYRSGPAVRARQGVQELETIADLRAWLGLSEAQLRYLVTATDRAEPGLPPPPYTCFDIPKRDGRPRKVCAPGYLLRRAQRRILRDILAIPAVHESAHAFVPGRSVRTNAAVHVGRPLLIKFDLVDFFPSIYYARVFGLFASLGYDVGHGRFSVFDGDRAIAPTLARLCVYAESPHEVGSAYAPQGAPTSPALSNLVCRNLDRRLAGLALKAGARYSRYADDLTFSFASDPPGGIGRFRWWVDEIVQQEGFALNGRKFRVVRASQRQIVTGVVVNDVPRVAREDRRRLRAILHNCRKHGVESQSGGRADFGASLLGWASWVNAIDPEEGRKLLREVRDVLGGTP